MGNETTKTDEFPSCLASKRLFQPHRKCCYHLYCLSAITYDRLMLKKKKNSSLLQSYNLMDCIENNKSVSNSHHDLGIETQKKRMVQKGCSSSQFPLYFFSLPFHAIL